LRASQENNLLCGGWIACCSHAPSSNGTPSARCLLTRSQRPASENLHRSGFEHNCTGGTLRCPKTDIVPGYTARSTHGSIRLGAWAKSTEESMKSCTTAILGVVTAYVFTLPAAQAQQAAKKPNVVIMLADNVGYGDVGAYGAGESRGMPTPRIDIARTLPRCPCCARTFTRNPRRNL
jgi:hypothetical protein